MNYLLDTHTLLWALYSPDKLSSRVRSLLEDQENDVQVSAISFWEISLKFGLGKLELPDTNPEELPQVSQDVGFSIVDLSPDLLSSYHRLELLPNHRDPFDRLLVWQAIQGQFCLLSKDKRLPLYQNQGLFCSW